MLLAEFLSVLTLCSILSISLSYGLPLVQKANDFEKNYEKLDVKAVADLFMKGGIPTEPLESNLNAYVHPKRLAERTILTAGQEPDLHNNKVPSSIYPFVVARNMVSDSPATDSLTDQFDVIEDKYGNEFIALYHGGVSIIYLSY